MRVILQSTYLTLEYLIWRQQNGLRSIDDQDIKTLKVIDVSYVLSRNLLSKVNLVGNESYVLKQYGSENKEESFLKNEIKFLHFLNENLSSHVPEILFYDDYNGIIASKLIQNSINLEKFLTESRQDGKWNDINTIVEEVAGLFTKIHGLDVSKSEFKPVDVYNIIKFDNFPKESAILQDLLFLYSNWPKPEYAKLVHFDPRPANLLKVDTKNLKILDWEFALLGDPIWDIAIFIISTCLTLGDSVFFKVTAPSRFGNIMPIVQAFCRRYFKNNTSYKETLKTYMRLQLYANGNENVTRYTTTINRLID